MSAAKPSPARTSKKTGSPPKRITETYLHNAGLYYLQRFASSRHHFCKVMMRKVDRSCQWHKDQDRESCKQMVDRLADKFVRLGLLDDLAYTKAMVTSWRRRGLSTRAIAAKLCAKGLQKTDIDAALENHDRDFPFDGDFIAALRLAKRKKIGPFAHHNKKDQKPAEKALSTLGRAGFSYDTAKNIMDVTAENAEKILTEL